MVLELATIEELAPDQASLNAAKKLVKAAKWPERSEGGGFIWGLCQGSGANPYRTVLDLGDHGYKCTCPSRKFPCKHVLALGWLRVVEPDAFTDGTPPDWVGDWLARRRPKSGEPAEADEDQSKAPRKSISAAAKAPASKRESPEERAQREERAAKARARNLARREELIAAGLEELDSWALELLARGAVASVSGLAERTAPIVRRLVDAKASALAARVDRIPSLLLERDPGERPAALLTELGTLHLISESYRRQRSLDPGLARDVRAAVGWTTTAEELFADPSAPRVHAEWEVVAQRDIPQPDRLRRIETWLWSLDEAAGATPCGVLVDFVPVSSGGSGGSHRVGATLTGEAVFYPSAVPQRVRLDAEGTRSTDPEPASHARRTLPGELARFRGAKARLPWLESFGIACDGVAVRAAEDGGLWLMDATAELQDAAGAEGLPLANAGDEARQLLGFGLTGVFGIVEADAVTLTRAHVEGLGIWRSE